MREQRPKTRGDCIGGERPCPWISCFWHVINERKGFNLTARQDFLILKSDEEILEEIFGMPETCILDVCDKGESTLEEIGLVMNVTRERIRQIGDSKKSGTGKAGKAMRKLRHPKKREFLKEFAEEEKGYYSRGVLE